MNEPFTDEQRFPLLDETGRQMLLWLREHPHAPRWNFRTGDRLTEERLAQVRAYETSLNSDSPGWTPGAFPEWLPAFVEKCLADVPFYRRRGGLMREFARIPTSGRTDLAREPWSFVPDSASLDGLIVYDTSGATGHPMAVLSHPTATAKYLPLLKRALAQVGVALEPAPGKVSLLNVCTQKDTAVIAAVSSYLDQSGVAKVNLQAHDWRDPADAARFLDACDAPVYLGDPISLWELSTLPLETRPKALLSTGMTLLPGLKKSLESRFECPVVNYYSLTESGPVAIETDEGFRLLPHDVYMEVLDPDGSPAAAGERGEITLTGGRNPFLPLLRYRTGDYAVLEYRGRSAVLANLEGRFPVVFHGSDGRPINNIDVSHSLAPFSLPQFNLHQDEVGALCLRIRGEGHPAAAIADTLRKLFGAAQALEVQELPDPDDWLDKALPYTNSASGRENGTFGA
jgi:phenylacetate-CoA ligase